MKLIYKELFEDTKLKNKISIFSILGYAFLITGLVIIILSLLSLWNNGFRIVLFREIDLSDMSSIGGFLSGTVGPVWALASMFFFLETIKLQQEELKEVKTNNKDQVNSELFYRTLDLLDLSFTKEIESTLVNEFREFTCVITILNEKVVHETFDLFAKTIPLEEKLKPISSSLKREQIEKVKALYDKMDEYNANNKKIILEKNPNQIIVLQSLFEIISKFSSKEKQQQFFLLLRIKEDALSNIYIMLLIFYNQLSWNIFLFYSLSDVLDFYSNTKDLNIEKENYLDFKKEILKIYKEMKENT